MKVLVIVAALAAAAYGDTTKATRAPKSTPATTTTMHPSCTEEAYNMCQDSCRAKNYEVLDDFIADVLGYTDGAFGGVPEPGNITRRRRGEVPGFIQQEVERFLRKNVRCADAKLKKKRGGFCVCSCKSKKVQLDCSHIQNGGFTDGTDWDVRERGFATSEVTDQRFFDHRPSVLPVGNGNYQGIAAGPDTLPENMNLGSRTEGPGQVILRQKFNIGEGANHVILVYGMAAGVAADGFAPMIGPNVQGYRVDIMKQDAGVYSVNPEDIAESLVIGAGESQPNIYVHDITDSVGMGGKYFLRYTAAALFDSQTVAVDHVHMCSIKCGRK